MKKNIPFFAILFAGLSALFSTAVFAADLYVGAASADMTPDRPILLQGQMQTRIAYEAETPITINALVLESRDGENVCGTAIFVSFDICSIRGNMQKALYKRFAEKFPSLDPEKTLIINATHTHTSIATAVGGFALPPDVNPDEILQGEEAAAFVADRAMAAISEAWEKRVPAQFSFGLGNAVFAFNRRSVYEDGKAEMYGDTKRGDFRKVEGMEDHDIGCVFFWDMNNKLLAMMVNSSCPAQEVEGRSKINADYWHPVREKIRAKYGEDVVVVSLCGAAGDLSPHIRYRNAAMDRMTNLRNSNMPLDDARLQEIARKVVAAVDEVYPVVEPVKTADVTFAHLYQTFDLPPQKIPADVYESFKKQTANWKADLDKAADNGVSGAYCYYHWTKRVVERYEAQQKDENLTYTMPAHFIRLGDLAIATNPFELYTDFAVQMKARTKAAQLIVVQLCGGMEFSSYVPSHYAVSGGGYGAIPQSNAIGADGGQVFADKSIEAVNSLFDEEK